MERWAASPSNEVSAESTHWGLPSIEDYRPLGITILKPTEDVVDGQTRAELRMKRGVGFCFAKRGKTRRQGTRAKTVRTIYIELPKPGHKTKKAR
ncbi:MAG TPA: hypothetical protein GX507_02690 [Clostridia bacterium]|nr:hypothetical protein [Clostridia bacterium]